MSMWLGGGFRFSVPQFPYLQDKGNKVSISLLWCLLRTCCLPGTGNSGLPAEVGETVSSQDFFRSKCSGGNKQGEGSHRYLWGGGGVS